MRDVSFREIREGVLLGGKETDVNRITGAAKVIQAAMRAARNTRFKALPVTCRRSAGQNEFYESAVMIDRVEFGIPEPGYTILCEVDIRSASGQVAFGGGVAVKGRKDTFSYAVGASVALKQAMEGAFTVLGQREGTGLGPSPFSNDDTPPADSIIITDFRSLINTEFLSHNYNDQKEGK